MNDDVRTEFKVVGAQLGGLGRALAILAASLHDARVIDAKAIARSIRLDAQGLEYENAKELMVSVAELIDEIIVTSEAQGPSGLKPV